MDKLKELDQLLADLNTGRKPRPPAPLPQESETYAQPRAESASPAEQPDLPPRADPRRSLAQLNSLVATLPAKNTEVPSVEEHTYEAIPNEQPPLRKASSNLDALLQTLSAGTGTQMQPQPASQGLKPVAVGTRPTPQPNGFCAACRELIVGASFAAMGMEFHEEHFMCLQCGKQMAAGIFYEHDAMPYCPTCFHENFSPRCGYCKKPIEDEFVQAIGQHWHPDHFFCSQCGQQLGDGLGFVEHDGRAYCQQDYDELFAEKCATCQKPIVDASVQAMDKFFHDECFVCAECLSPFPDGQFFEHQGLPLCSTHFHAKIGAVCDKCSKPITGKVMKALGNKFHPQCFRCATCSRMLADGTFFEQYGQPCCLSCSKA